LCHHRPTKFCRVSVDGFVTLSAQVGLLGVVIAVVVRGGLLVAEETIKLASEEFVGATDDGKTVEQIIGDGLASQDARDQAAAGQAIDR
jgi:hypothetical protein